MLETGQPITITTAPNLPVQFAATDLTGKTMPVPSSTRQAPLVPSFLTILQNDITLLNAAVFFADTREADFTTCGKSDTREAANQSTIERHTRPDPLWRVWLLILIAALLVSWKFNAREPATA
jgi:hypothetical protein